MELHHPFTLPVMRILYDTASFFRKQILPKIESKWRKRLAFGFESLSIRPVSSLRGNARMSGEKKVKTAETKIYRVSHTKRLMAWFPLALPRIVLAGRSSTAAFVNIDFSDFQGRQVLLFSLQTREGRAIPLFFDSLRYPVEKGSQNTFIIRAVERFLGAIPNRTRVHLVFDRGFSLPPLMRFLCLTKAKFTIRVKGVKHVGVGDGKTTAARDVKETDLAVQANGLTLRLVVSEKKEGMKEPWYLLTSDTDSSREEIIDIYYHRFEIEEFFKDAKRLSLLEYLPPMGDDAFTVVLWFLILGYAISWMTKTVRSAWHDSWKKGDKAKRKTSLFRFFLEGLAAEGYLALRRTLVFRLWEV
jgi:hypothetical protein